MLYAVIQHNKGEYHIDLGLQSQRYPLEKTVSYKEIAAT